MDSTRGEEEREKRVKLRPFNSIEWIRNTSYRVRISAYPFNSIEWILFEVVKLNVPLINMSFNSIEWIRSVAIVEQTW